MAETSWDKEEYFNENNIKEKIEQKTDLFNRGHTFERVNIDGTYPEYLQKTKTNLRVDFIMRTKIISERFKKLK